MLSERARGGRYLRIRLQAFRHRRVPSQSPHQCAEPERCGSHLVSLSKRDGAEGKKMLRSLGLVGPTPGGAEREDRASRTRGRRCRSVVKFQHFQYVTIARSGQRLCSYTRHHLQQNARQDNPTQLLPVACRKQRQSVHLCVAAHVW